MNDTSTIETEAMRQVMELINEEIELEDPLHNDPIDYGYMKREKPEHRNMIYLKAQGMSNKEIAEATGYKYVAVSRILRQPFIREKLLKEIRSAGKEGVDQLLKGSAADSVIKLIDLRDTAKSEMVQKSAADSLLDRYLGKPTQKVEAHVSQSKDTLAEVDKEISQLEQQEKHLLGRN